MNFKITDIFKQNSPIVGTMEGLTQKQINFTRLVFEGRDQRSAYIQAGYSDKSAMSTIDAHASRLANNGKVLAFLDELNEKANSERVATKEEAAAVLTEQLRARVTDFLTCSADGVWFYDIGPEILNTHAIKKIKTSTIVLDKDKPDDAKIIITDLELYDPRGAAETLSKFFGWNAPEKHEHTGKDGGPIEIDHRAVLINRITNLIERRGTSEIPERTQ